MSDLIEWLRFQDKTYGAEELGEAADEIERLQRENEELRKEVASCQEELRLCQQDAINALKAQSTEQPVAFVDAGHLREVSNGNEMLIWASPEQDDYKRLEPVYLIPPTATALVEDFKRRAMNVEVVIPYTKQEETNAFVAGLNAYYKAIESLPLIEGEQG